MTLTLYIQKIRGLYQNLQDHIKYIESKAGHKIKLHISQVEPKNPTAPESRPKLSGADESTATFNTIKFYDGEIPFRNEGSSTLPLQCVELVDTQNTPVNTPREMSGTQMSPPSVTNTQNDTHTTGNLPP